MHRRPPGFWPLFLLIAIVLSLSGGARAHEIRPAIAEAVFHADGRFTIEMQVNLEAILAEIGPEHKDTDDSPNAARYNALRELPPAALAERFHSAKARFLGDLGLHFDGRPVTARLDAVEPAPVGDTRVARQTTLRLSGTVPPDAERFTWHYPDRHGALALKIKRFDDAEFTTRWLPAGTPSDPFPLHGLVPERTTLETLLLYLELGFVHIVPKGLDHILFVLGLFLLSVRMKPLLVQVTSFTVAHSITLALSLYGVIALDPAIVEPLIALSIAFVAVENVLTSRLSPWRPFVVFAFGLLHGLGFAGVLTELGLPSDQFVTALVGFNLGVEAGQLAVILAAFLLVGIWGMSSRWYRPWVVIPSSAAIAVVGLYWTVERVGLL